jgi:hypothetical protein
VQVLCEVTAGFTLSNPSPEEGQVVYVTNTSQSATQYEWFIDGVSQGGTLDSVVFGEAGVYKIELNAANNYCADKTYLIVSVRDSCQYSGFQLTINVGAGGGGYWNNGRVIQLNDGKVILGSSWHHTFDKKQVMFSAMSGIGDILWSKVLGDSARDAEIFALQPVADGGFAAITLVGGGYYTVEQSGLMKLSSDGELMWYRYYLSDSLEYFLRDLVCNPDGSIVACGRVRSGGGSHVLIVKFASDGGILWEKRYKPTSTNGRDVTSMVM